MNAIDYLKAVGVAVGTIAFTMAASFPMVAVYAYLIEPGHEQEFYTAAAQWIAPWSSYILGPLTFFAFNYLLAKKSPERNAIAFAFATIIAYLIVDLSMVPALGGEIAMFLTFGFAFSIAVKLGGALLGAHVATLQSAGTKISDGGT